jgi:hypothetical protein
MTIYYCHGIGYPGSVGKSLIPGRPANKLKTFPAMEFVKKSFGRSLKGMFFKRPLRKSNLYQPVAKP